MTGGGGHILHYRIVVRSESAGLLASLGEHVHVESADHGRTTLIASLRDEAEFWGLMDRFQDLALHLVSLQELGAREDPRP
jgi:hypothetical protein